jgi:hypothetical protein
MTPNLGFESLRTAYNSKNHSKLKGGAHNFPTSLPQPHNILQLRFLQVGGTPAIFVNNGEKQ